MSSYLNIYGIPKEGDKPIEIVSFSRSHCVYRAICDEINIAWAGNSDVYTNLTTEMIDQVAMVVEECSELTNAICKFRRGRVGEDDIITEIADVMIMCEQLSNYFGKEKVELEKERKLERLKERLSKYTD